MNRRHVLVLWTLVYVPAVLAGSVAPLKFFSNSVRREAEPYEADQVAKVKGCTAYFVENTSGKILLGSARHCFGYSATNWCKTDGKITRNDGEKGQCVRIVAGDRSHDLVMFEATFPTPPKQTLRLAAYQPKLGSRMKMIGYPCDKYRSCKLTVTENCWVIKERVASPHGGTMNDESSLHNCTTYGGNSGGPMILENDTIVLGLPFTYAPRDYKERDPAKESTAGHMAQMADFVHTFRTQLEAEGVAIVD